MIFFFFFYVLYIEPTRFSENLLDTKNYTEFWNERKVKKKNLTLNETLTHPKLKSKVMGMYILFSFEKIN